MNCVNFLLILWRVKWDFFEGRGRNSAFFKSSCSVPLPTLFSSGASCPSEWREDLRLKPEWWCHLCLLLQHFPINHHKFVLRNISHCPPVHHHLLLLGFCNHLSILLCFLQIHSPSCGHMILPIFRSFSGSLRASG